MREVTRYICVTFNIVPEDGQYSAVCPELGTASCGETVDEAVKNIREAVLVDLNTLEHFGERERFFSKRKIRMYSRPIESAGKPLTPKVGEFITRQNIPVVA